MNLVVEVCLVGIVFVSTQGANDFLFHDNRDAKERLVFGLAAARAVQEVRVFRDRRDDNRFTRFDDTAGNAFAHLVTALARLAAAQTFCNFNGNFAGMAVVQRKRCMLNAHHRFNGLQNRMRHGFEIKTLVQDGADLVEQLQFLDSTFFTRSH